MPGEAHSIWKQVVKSSTLQMGLWHEAKPSRSARIVVAILWVCDQNFGVGAIAATPLRREAGNRRNTGKQDELKIQSLLMISPAVGQKDGALAVGAISSVMRLHGGPGRWWKKRQEDYLGSRWAKRGRKEANGPSLVQDGVRHVSVVHACTPHGKGRFASGAFPFSAQGDTRVN